MDALVVEGRKIFLKDVAIVCANCHVMIHANGKCRRSKV